MTASRNIAAVTISLLVLSVSQVVLAEENIQERSC